MIQNFMRLLQAIAYIVGGAILLALIFPVELVREVRRKIF